MVLQCAKCAHWIILQNNLQCPCMQAFNVLRQCYSYEKRPAKVGLILFNIKRICVGLLRQKGIRGTAVNGTKYTFLTGTRVFFSSRQCDTKCTLRECAEVIQFPQEATAFLLKEKSKQFPNLMNLSELTFTGKEERLYLVVSKINEDDSSDHMLHTLPVNSDTKVNICTFCVVALSW